MVRYLFFSLMMVHGLIHLIGFFKSLESSDGLAGRFTGIFWLICSICFLISAVVFFLQNSSWAWIAIASLIGSQILILSVWQEARFGTVANVCILLAAILTLVVQQINVIFRD
jgi:hypothetical protein